MPKAKFEPAIPASEQPQTNGLDPAVTGMDKESLLPQLFYQVFSIHSLSITILQKRS